MLSSRLRHTVTIQRVTHGSRNDYGVPAETWSTLATVKGWLQPNNRTESDEASSGGAVNMTATLFLMPTDITEADRVVVNGSTYDVMQVLNAAGKDQHYELQVRRTEVV